MGWFLKFTNLQRVFLVYDPYLVPQRAVISLLSLHMWATTPDFSTSPHITNFWCSLSLTLRGQPASPLYFLPQLHMIAYTVFSHVLLYVGFLLRRDIWEVSSGFWRLSWCYVEIYIHVYIYIYIYIYGVFRECLVPLVRGLAISFLWHLVCHWTFPATQLSPVTPHNCRMQQWPHPGYWLRQAC